MHSFGGQLYTRSGFLDARAAFRIVVERVDISIAINFYLHSNFTVQMARYDNDDDDNDDDDDDDNDDDDNDDDDDDDDDGVDYDDIGIDDD